MPIPKLTHKIKIEGTITCKTGLRIGGNKSSLEIGGLDLNIIKSAAGVPYLPGSSIKGKLRSLLGKVRGSEKAGDDNTKMKNLFGGGGGREDNFTTRLFVRDAELDTKAFEKEFGEKPNIDFAYSEVKTENVISRTTGKAEHPRSIERVPAGARFLFNMVLDIYAGDTLEDYLELLTEAFSLLHYDYLGGHGSRGSGQVQITLCEVSGISIAEGNITKMDHHPALTALKDQFSPQSVTE